MMYRCLAGNARGRKCINVREDAAFANYGTGRARGMAFASGERESANCARIDRLSDERGLGGPSL